MADFFEVLMVVLFGCSWPMNIHRAWIARTAKSTSLLFYLFIFVGYLFGLVSKAIKLQNGVSTPFYVWFFYTLNTCMVFVGILVYLRNRVLDRRAEEASSGRP